MPSLALPPLPHVQRPPPVEQLAQYEAVRLFIDRALALRPDFAVTNQNALAVAQVCVRLDGIPLALELAAARVRVLPAEQLLARLENRFRLLTGGSRTALPRQQTLQATVDWSYDLLGEAERRLFARRLSRASRPPGPVWSYPTPHNSLPGDASSTLRVTAPGALLPAVPAITLP